MINVNFLRQRTEDLARKHSSGWETTDEWNRHLSDSQIILFNFYYSIFEKTRRVSDALSPFIKNESITLTQGIGVLPADYCHLNDVCIASAINPTECGEEPSETIYECPALRRNERSETLSSSIRKPSIAKNIYRHEVEFPNIRVWPKETPSASLNYFRKPNEAIWAGGLNAITGIETYNAASSIDLEWGATEQGNLLDLMLLHKGLAIRENELIQWAGAKSGLVYQIVK